MNQETRKKGKRRLLGYAEVKKDDISGKQFWQTYDGDGKNEVIYSAGQPLEFRAEFLQIGVRIELFAPEE